MRIVIIGGPKTGKTTMADHMRGDGVTVRHTDDLQDLEWSEASACASFWFDEPGPWIIEGVMAVRALRKWLARNPEGKPCDRIIVRWHAKVQLSKGQMTMTRGHETIWNAMVHEVDTRGVEIVQS